MKSSKYKAVLIVEDDPNDVAFMQMAFGQAGVANPLFVVQSGLDAIAYLEGKGNFGDRDRYPFPTLMLLDLKMPGSMDGFDVLNWWQKRGKSPDLRIIVLSGSEDAEDIRKSQTLGAAAYRIKNTDYTSWLSLAREVRDRWLAIPFLEFDVDEGRFEVPFYRERTSQSFNELTN